MARALLINPSYARTYGATEGGIAFPVYPILSLAALAGAARERGHDVDILDLSYRQYEPETIRETVRRVRPDVVGITATTPLANQMRDMSYLVKEVDSAVLTVAGGAHPTALAAETLRQSAIDMVAAGEADFVVADLLDGRRLAEIGGLYWRDGESIATSGRKPLVANLDDLPMPAWECYPADCNKHVTKVISRRRPVAAIEFSRGCLYACEYCASRTIMGRGYRKKSPERCAEEMERLARLGFREAIVVDDIFTSDRDWAAAVCERIIRRGPAIPWSCTNGIRVDSASDGLFSLMRRAGCYRVYFGVESGDDEVLRHAGKGGRATLERARAAVRSARTAGLEPNGFFLVGLSGDTAETMRRTIDAARTLDLDTMKCGICIPFPGTPMFDALNRGGSLRTLEWDAYTIYNQAERIYDHPSLDWATITRHLRRFYVQAYFANPRYLWRRLRYAVRTGEILWNAWYTLKFVLTLWGPKRGRQPERYAFERRWRPLDLDPGASLPSPFVPLAVKGGGATARDNVVTGGN